MLNHSTRSGGIIGIYLFNFLYLEGICVFSLESPHRGNSNEYTQYTIFKSPSIIIPNLQLWDFFKGLKNEFKTSMVKEPSVLEPLKVYCMWTDRSEQTKQSNTILLLKEQSDQGLYCLSCHLHPFRCVPAL